MGVDFPASAFVCLSSRSKRAGGTPSGPGRRRPVPVAAVRIMRAAGIHMAFEGAQMFSSTSVSLGNEARATPLDDLENVVAIYQPRVFRFLLATLRDRSEERRVGKEG